MRLDDGAADAGTAHPGSPRRWEPPSPRPPRRRPRHHRPVGHRQGDETRNPSVVSWSRVTLAEQETTVSLSRRQVNGPGSTAAPGGVVRITLTSTTEPAGK